MTQRTLKSTLAEYYHDRPQGEDNEEVQEDITDILTDLRHLCIAEEIDFEQCNEQAAAHFASETGGQPERADFAGQALDNRAKRSSITTHSRVLDNANTRKR